MTPFTVLLCRSCADELAVVRATPGPSRGVECACCHTVSKEGGARYLLVWVQQHAPDNDE